MLRPGFGPGSATFSHRWCREAAILDRTILPEHWTIEDRFSDLKLFSRSFIPNWFPLCLSILCWFYESHISFDSQNNQHNAWFYSSFLFFPRTRQCHILGIWFSFVFFSTQCWRTLMPTQCKASYTPDLVKIQKQGAPNPWFHRCHQVACKSELIWSYLGIPWIS